ncbi:MAG: hypothetical protein LBC85_08500 [Fibromonadaceae bacterium]|jgi:hypothetical protein|nr:hypothetical protein [Fibromonadaceae bacterium]
MTQRTPLAAFRRSILIATFALSLFACSSGGDDSDNKFQFPESGPLLLNFTSDYITGELRWMSAESASLAPEALSFGQDTKIAAYNGNVFILERLPSSNLSCLIGRAGTIKQKSLEAGSMPYDLAVIGSKGYIALNEADYIQVFDVNTCNLGNKINLPIVNSNAATIKASGDTLLVVLQRLENYVATEPGLLLRINASTETLIDTIQLNFYNPHASLLSKGKLFIASVDYFGASTGIEIVDLASGEIEILFDGGVSSMALDESTQTLYASVYVGWGEVPVKPINLSDKSVGEALPGIIDAYNGLVFDKENKKLFIADVAGLKVYDTQTKAMITVANDLPPYSLAIN